MTAIQAIPLSQLRLSPKNSRKRRSPETVAAIAESLKVHGQLQNLVVTARSEDGLYNVDAGGTRLLAFQLRLDRGEIPADHPVDCKIVGDVDALEASTAENTLREAMHPADQFRAFRAMIDDGRSVDEVAAHFSTPTSVVTQRLKLANVAPELFELYDQGQMKLEQLQALALTDDHEAQRKAWFGTKGEKVQHDWQRRPDEIRKRITSKEIGPDNPLVKFVGADQYEVAGGVVRRDMFSDDVYFSDAKLLETLASNKLEAIALDERNTGWSWVEVHLQMDYSAQSRYADGPFRPTYGKVTKEDQARIDEIGKRLKEIEAIDDRDDDVDFEQLNDEAERLERELSDLRAGRAVWSDEAKTKTGVLIYIDRYHGLQVERGRLLPGQRVSAGKVDGKAKDAGSKKPTLSQDMVTRLEMHRAAAIREHVAARPAMALQLLLTHLLTKLFTDTYAESVLALTPTNQHKEARGQIESKFQDLGKSAARKAIDDRIAAWKKAGLPGKASELFGWVGKLDQAKQLELLALATALTVSTNGGHRGQALAEQFEVDMAAWWSTSADSFVSLVPKSLLAEAVADVDGKAAGEAVLAMKKDAAMADAAKRLQGKGWLPKPLRGANYKAAKPTSSKPASTPAPAPAAKKATAKKATPKQPAKPAKKASKAPAKKATKAATKKGAK